MVDFRVPTAVGLNGQITTYVSSDAACLFWARRAKAATLINYGPSIALALTSR